jgi:non-ribosomal peptide synthetase component E (peptide arylation enzyme)
MKKCAFTSSVAGYRNLGCPPRVDEAVTFLKGQIADYKLPETIERFDEFPMTGTGKIRCHVLCEWVLTRHKRLISS